MFSSISRAKEKQNLRDCFLHSKHRSQCWKEEWSKCLKFSLGQYREMDFVLHQLMEPLTLSWSSPWFWSPPIINPYLMIQAQPTNVWYTPINLAPSNINQPHFSLSWMYEKLSKDNILLTFQQRIWTCCRCSKGANSHKFYIHLILFSNPSFWPMLILWNIQ